MRPVLVWFRRDLRLSDHPALVEACATGAPLVPVFVDSASEEAPWKPGRTARWWQQRSLTVLDAELRGRGSRLVVRRGPAGPVLAALARETGASAVYWHRRVEPWARRQEEEVRGSLRDVSVEARELPDAWLCDPEAGKGDGTAYRVFTPFWRAAVQRGPFPEPLPAPPRLTAPAAWPAGDGSPDGLDRPPTPSGIAHAWTPGCVAGGAILARLPELIEAYPVARDVPAQPGTSRLSPYLRHGEVTPRQAVALLRTVFPGDHPGSAAFVRELGWREFAATLLHHFPHTVTDPLQGRFGRLPTRDCRRDYRAWMRGRTGYPLVDAGMRELAQTGWMHNRVRMITASFLTKHLLLPWQWGAAWFWRRLVDADWANNTLGWQWTAGCGADAAPFHRIFNPVLQGERFDPEGDYVRTWLPELGRLASPWIHRPWAAPEAVRLNAGVRLGTDYPYPIVDHSAARARALSALVSASGGQGT